MIEFNPKFHICNLKYNRIYITQMEGSNHKNKWRNDCPVNAFLSQYNFSYLLIIIAHCNKWGLNFMILKTPF